MSAEALQTGKSMYTEPLLVVMVVIAAVTDIGSRRIPNVLVAGGLVIALILQVFLPVGGSWQAWLFGALTGLLMFLPFYILRGMGAGDVKLMAAVGSFAGPSLALKIGIATFIIGGIWSLVVIIAKGKLRETGGALRALMLPVLMRTGGVPSVLPGTSVGRIPYGVSIALGTLTILYLKRA